ncbi:MAG: type IX secretion system sortase PorU, partial [Candidatus Azobacteroides sp.]|nr:type IX secretion system sortase PorU [Candidatus Azobacteroides sp.]
MKNIFSVKHIFIFFSFIFSLPIFSEEFLFSTRSGNTGLHSYASSSVLSTGRWVKIRVAETGIYKLTYEELKRMGFSDPAKVQVYGYGGWMLNEDFSLPKTDDLPKLNVWVEGAADSNSSYILFYAKGPVKWNHTTSVSSQENFTHTNNPYSDYGYYFLTQSEESTNKMPVNDFKDEFTQELFTFDDYALHERDLINIGHTGREFYGEDFSYNTSQNFTFSIPGITNDEGYINVNFIAKASVNTPLSVNINSGNTLTGTLNASVNNSYEYAKELTVRGSWSEAKQETNIINLTYGAAGHTNARLNFIRLNFKRKLQPYGAYTFFRDTSAIKVATKYTLANASQHIKIWNITDGEKVSQMETRLSGTNLSFTSDASVLEEFVAVDLSKSGQFPTPEIVGEIKNQNLHALSQTDMVIITHPDFTEQAERIAELHRDHDNLRVHVIETEDIYNEFSSGTPDATAYRWLMKMFYDRGKAIGDENELPKYLLLFGDGTFDNKLIHSDWSGTEIGNKILTYQSDASLIETSSYVVDDYFGFLDDDEGKSLQNDGLDIGIGRFPVRTVEEAKNV